ncbi:MAG: DUF4154 domain-containing protein [Pirellulales bacterium]|nr:DUF4154 domain-containing protein [Pirellulales bacterium]
MNRHCVSNAKHLDPRLAATVGVSRRARLLAWFLAIALSAGGAGTALAQEEESTYPTSSREYTIKAAYLYNFARYVNWPDGTFANDDSPLVIGVLGENPFGNALQTIAERKKIDGRRLVIRQFSSLDQYTTCHVLFVVWNINEEEQKAVIKRLGGSHVLLVGETPDFTKEGGVVSFYIEENRVRFEINVAAARRESLKISSKLLNLAKLVGQSNGRWARMADTTPTSGGWPTHAGSTPWLPKR